ncbi:MAG TPA: hypothetical protein VKB88_40875 [Bryobacteraceae bacterium]|nr:hypothetical protein [Bryobacteraceae bacterium]
MNPHTRRAAVVAGLLIGLWVMSAALYGAMRIGGSSFAVNGQVARDHQYTGGCPVDLTFDWGVINSDPTAISYWTSRNDNAHSNPRSLNHPGSNRSMPIMEHWRLGANNPQFANYHGWMEIHIESPAPATNRIPFTLHCR